MSPINDKIQTIEFDEIKKLEYNALVDYYNDLIKKPTSDNEDAQLQNMLNNGTRGAILYNIMSYYIQNNYEVCMSGILEIIGTYGFLRDLNVNFTTMPYDIHISTKFIEDFNLKVGDDIRGIIEAPKNNNSKLFTIKCIKSINGVVFTNDNKSSRKMRKTFENLISLYPSKQIKLEIPNSLTGRIIDLVAPMGFGQRALVVAPPKAGKTTMMRDIAKGVIHNHNDNDTYLMILLVGERPEEATLMKRSIPSADVLYSTFDEPPEQHIRVAELAMEKAKRMAESGKNVVVIVDSISRLVRAYNYTVASSGKVLSGGVETAALYKVKSFFGSARNLEHAGSITIIASCLVNTGSRMDDMIFEELKGTGNSEIYLDMKLAEERKFPAVNVTQSSTRKPESFIDPTTLARINLLMQLIQNGGTIKSFDHNGYSNKFNVEKTSSEHAYKMLVDRLNKTKTNAEFLDSINS